MPKADPRSGVWCMGLERLRGAVVPADVLTRPDLYHIGVSWHTDVPWRHSDLCREVGIPTGAVMFLDPIETTPDDNRMRILAGEMAAVLLRLSRDPGDPAGQTSLFREAALFRPENPGVYSAFTSDVEYDATALPYPTQVNLLRVMDTVGQLWPSWALWFEARKREKNGQPAFDLATAPGVVYGEDPNASVESDA